MSAKTDAGLDVLRAALTEFALAQRATPEPLADAMDVAPDNTLANEIDDGME